MPTQARPPAEHYAEAERLLSVAESPTVDPGIRDLAAVTAIGHALLAAAPRRARKRPEPPARHTGDRWMFGGDQ